MPNIDLVQRTGLSLVPSGRTELSLLGQPSRTGSVSRKSEAQLKLSGRPEEVKTAFKEHGKHHHHHEVAVPPAPPLPARPETIQLPSFFEEEGILADLATKKVNPVTKAGKRGCVVRTRKTRLEPHPLSEATEKNPLPDSGTRPPLAVPIITIGHSQSGTDSVKRQSSRRDLKEQKRDIRDRFRVAFEKNDGKLITDAMAQMDKDIVHYERTLAAVQRRKIALLYHVKYLTKVLRKNRVQARHAFSLGKSVGELLKETMHAQLAIAKQTGIVNVGVRSQLVQMKDVLWTKLGMREYKPSLEVPVAPSPASDHHHAHHTTHSHHPDHHHHRHHGGHHRHHDGDLFHIPGRPDLARMECVQRLLEPANFALLVEKPGGLLAAQQYLINYLKQCSEVYDWMKSMKITYPTAQGFRREAIKSLPYFDVDTGALFAGLRPVEDPLAVLHDQFPAHNFVFERINPSGDVKTLAAMFQAEPLSDRAADEPKPTSGVERILYVDVPAKLLKGKHDSSLMSFEDYAARNLRLFSLVAPLLEPEEVPKVPADCVSQALVAENDEVILKVPTYEERHPLQSPKPDSPNKHDHNTEDDKNHLNRNTKTPEIKTHSHHDMMLKADRAHTPEPDHSKSPAK